MTYEEVAERLKEILEKYKYADVTYGVRDLSDLELKHFKGGKAVFAEGRWMGRNINFSFVIELPKDEESVTSTLEEIEERLEKRD